MPSLQRIAICVSTKLLLPFYGIGFNFHHTYSRYNVFPSRRTAGGFGVPPPRSTSTSQSSGMFGGHRWGSGRVLRANVD